MDSLAAAAASIWAWLLASWYVAGPLALAAALAAALLLAYAGAQTRVHEAKEEAGFQASLVALRARVVAARLQGAPLTALITGANSGLGFSLARTLARERVRVVLGCRSAERGKEAVRRILADVPAADLGLLIVDVSDPASVLAAVAQLRADAALLGPARHIDLLFLNAGIMPVGRQRWDVPLRACLGGRFLHFLETGRAAPAGPHFLQQPRDTAVACGAPSLFATHVLGHVLLVEEAAAAGLLVDCSAGPRGWGSAIIRASVRCAGEPAAGAALSLPLPRAGGASSASPSSRAAGAAVGSGAPAAAAAVDDDGRHFVCRCRSSDDPALSALPPADAAASTAAAGLRGPRRRAGSGGARSPAAGATAAGAAAAATAAAAPGACAPWCRRARIVWTGSRAACAPALDWAHLAPPRRARGRSGFQRGFAAAGAPVQREAYGEAKYATELVAPALARRLPGCHPLAVICPGAVDTEIMPGFFKPALALFPLLRAYLPGFNITAARGTHAMLAAAVHDEPPPLSPEVKYVTWAGSLVPATAGAWPVPRPAQERMYALVATWLAAWRAHVAAGAEGAQ